MKFVAFCGKLQEFSNFVNPTPDAKKFVGLSMGIFTDIYWHISQKHRTRNGSKFSAACNIW